MTIIFKMSLQLLDENSFSDSKMDISDATTSMESTGVSPEFENLIKLQCQPTGTIQDNQNNSTIQKISEENNIVSPVDTDQVKNIGNDKNIEDMLNMSKPLDNRIILPLNFNGGQQQQMQSQQRPNIIARTLANSHPLMSPGTDSDSEHSREQGISNEQKSHCYQSYNFPDVIPASEHHHHINTKTTDTTPQHSQVTMLRTHSLDLISSESEADVSQYRATVEKNLQSVALISNNITNTKAIGSKSNARRLCARKNGCDDISSLDSISNHSFDDDEDIEHNLASLSPSISITDGLDDYDDDDDEGPDLFEEQDINEDDLNDGLNAVSLAPKSLPTVVGQCVATACEATPVSPVALALPQYSLAEERRNSRNWQKVTLSDGRLFEIDMRVIEPYKRVLSHGGYLKAGGQNAIVIFCACHLPDRSRADYNYVMDNLFLYVVKTLEQLVTDDYVLIYLHGGCSRRNVPPFPWIKKCYQLLDRRLRKSLKNMYLVHPTFWVKSIVWMARPFVSVKFWRKLVYVKSLEELGKYVSVEKAAIPEKVKQYDAKHN